MELLPTEILTTIFGHVASASSDEPLLACERVCMRWSEVIVATRWFPVLVEWTERDYIVRNRLIESLGWKGDPADRVGNRIAFLALRDRLSSDAIFLGREPSVQKESFRKSQDLSDVCKRNAVWCDVGRGKAYVESVANAQVSIVDLNTMSLDGCIDLSLQGTHEATNNLLWNGIFFVVGVTGRVKVVDAGEPSNTIASLAVPVSTDKDFGCYAAVNSKFFVAIKDSTLFIYEHEGQLAAMDGAKPAFSMTDFQEGRNQQQAPNVISSSISRIYLNERFLVTLACYSPGDGDEVTIRVRRVAKGGIRSSPVAVLPFDAGELVGMSLSNWREKQNLLLITHIPPNRDCFFLNVWDLDTMTTLRSLQLSENLLCSLDVPFQMMPSLDEDLLLMRREYGFRECEEISVVNLKSNSFEKRSVDLSEATIGDQIIATSRFGVLVLARPVAGWCFRLTKYEFWD